MTSKNIFKIAFAIDAILLALSLFAFFNFSDGVPFHFNHKGESRLLLPRISSFAHFAISISITLFLLLIAKFSTSFAQKKALRHYYAPVAATAFSLILLSSLLVSLTHGMRLFMFAEPVILLALLAFIAIAEIACKRL